MREQLGSVEACRIKYRFALGQIGTSSPGSSRVLLQRDHRQMSKSPSLPYLSTPQISSTQISKQPFSSAHSGQADSVSCRGIGGLELTIHFHNHHGSVPCYHNHMGSEFRYCQIGEFTMTICKKAHQRDTMFITEIGSPTSRQRPFDGQGRFLCRRRSRYLLCIILLRALPIITEIVSKHDDRRMER